MAFADTLVAHTDAEVVLVDRRHRPGGHWLDAYPFVRLHQPSAYYGVESTALGNDRIDHHGPNAGFYERASGAEICDYYSRALDEYLLPTGRARFFGMSEYRRNGDRPPRRIAARRLRDVRKAAVQGRRRDVRRVGDPSRVTFPDSRSSRASRSFRPTASLTSSNLRIASRWSARGRLRSTRACGCSRRESTPTGSAGYAAATRGSSTAASCSRSTWSVRTCGSRRAGSRRRRRPRTAMISRRRLEDAGVFVRIDPRSSRWRFAAPPSARARSTLSARSSTSCGRGGCGASAGRGSRPTRAISPAARARSTSTARPQAFVPRFARPVFEPGRITIQYVAMGLIPWCAATIGFVESTGPRRRGGKPALPARRLLRRRG